MEKITKIETVEVAISRMASPKLFASAMSSSFPGRWGRTSKATSPKVLRLK